MWSSVCWTFRFCFEPSSAKVIHNLLHNLRLFCRMGWDLLKTIASHVFPDQWWIKWAVHIACPGNRIQKVRIADNCTGNLGNKRILQKSVRCLIHSDNLIEKSATACLKCTWLQYICEIYLRLQLSSVGNTQDVYFPRLTKRKRLERGERFFFFPINLPSCFFSSPWIWPLLLSRSLVFFFICFQSRLISSFSPNTPW